MPKVVYNEPYNRESKYVDSSGKEHLSIAHEDHKAFDVSKEVFENEPLLIEEKEAKQAQQNIDQAAAEAEQPGAEPRR